MDVHRGRYPEEAAHRIEDHDARAETVDGPMHPRQVHLEAKRRRASRLELEEAAINPWLEIDADRSHVPHDLRGRFLEQERERALAAAAGGVHEVGGQTALAGAGGAGHENRAPPEVAFAAEHRIEPRDAGRDSFGRNGMAEPKRRHRQDRDPVLVDQERIFVGPVGRAAVLHDAETSRGDLVGHSVVEQDHRVRHVLLEPLSRQRPLAALAGDQGGDALVLEPAKQPAQLGPKDARVRQAREQRLDRVEHDTTGADRVDRIAQANEEPLEIVVAGLLDLAAVDADVVERDFLFLDQSRQVEAQGGDVLRQLLGALLEAHEHPGLVEPGRAMDEEADGEQGLTTPGSAT